ncbi:MAG TPA: hypothetical protein PLU22_13580 [Polyangiaceae bacterium]|nr:hypothetical protein [Polyangiaceae bacterium]
MTSSLEAAFRSRAAAACERRPQEELALAGYALDCAVSGSGLAEVRTRGARATPRDAVEALRANPARGFSIVLTPDGRLVRRLLLEPAIWMVPERLRGELDRLVAGEAEPGAAPEQEPVLRAVEAFEPAPGAEGALAAYLLLLDEGTVDGTRHRLSGPSILAVTIAGPGLARRRHRTRREAAVLRALATRPDAATFFLRSLGVDRAGDLSEPGREVNDD